MAPDILPIVISCGIHYANAANNDFIFIENNLSKEAVDGWR